MDLKSKYVIILIYLLLCAFISDVYGQQQMVVSSSSLSGHHGSISFVENKGQWEEFIKFKSEIRGGALFFEPNGVTFTFLDPDFLEKRQAIKTGATSIKLEPFVNAYAYKMCFLGSNTNPVVEGHLPFEEYHNYYLGSDPAKWASNVKKYEQINYKQLYKGIDLLFFENHNTYKYEFIVEPEANPYLIKIYYEGAEKILLKKKNLFIKTGKYETVELAPYAYQLLDNGEKRQIECSFVVEENTVHFALGGYDASRKLIIDPVLIFASFSGSVADNWGYTATYDHAGNLYGGGTVYGIGYPTSLGVFQTAYGGGSCDIAITKFSSNGTQAIYATYLGGSNADAPHSLIVNDNDELYVLATTSSANYPITSGAYSATFGGGTNVSITNSNLYTFGSDVAISRFNAAGTQLLSSTFFGGSGNDGLNLGLVNHYAEEIRGEIQVDSGNVYIVSSTSSTNLPTTAGAFQPVYGGGNQDGFIAKFSADLKTLRWCSYFGGNYSDAIYSMELDAASNIYICGGTTSSNLPTTPMAITPVQPGGWDGFIAKISANGSSILAATYYGKNGYDQVHLLTMDKDNNIVVVGQTDKIATDWIFNAHWSDGNGQFISKLSNDLTSVIWSTSFGSATLRPNISPTALMVDICNDIYLSAWGGISGNSGLSTTGMPITATALQKTTNGSDFYFMAIDANASSLKYATFFGGKYSQDHVDGGTSRFDKKGCIYQAVCAACGRADFPVTPNVVGPTNNSNNCNLGVIKIDLDLQTVVADFTMPNVVCINVEIDFINRSKGFAQTRYFWTFGDGATDTLSDPSHIYTAPGRYKVTLIVTDSTSCNVSDTITKEIIVTPNQSKVIPDMAVCKGTFVQIGENPSPDPNTSYNWYPSTGLSNGRISNPMFIDTFSRSYMMIITRTVCVDTVFQRVNIIDVPKGGNTGLTYCLGDSVKFIKDTFKMASYIWSSNPSFSDTLNSSINNPYLGVVLTQPTSFYYLKRVKEKCTILDTLQLNASSFQLSFDDFPKTCLGDTTKLNVKIDNPHHCSSFAYNWQPSIGIIGSNQVRNPKILVQTPTSFYVEVTNEYNCKTKDSVFVDIVALVSDILIKQISCYSMHDGVISIRMSGGDAPYSYKWGHASIDTAYFGNLQKGLYKVRIKDSNNCIIDTSISIIEPSALHLVLDNVIDSVDCDGICGGQALAVASGGTLPYNFAWITGDTTAFLGNLCAGEYFLLLTDNHGCRDSVVLEVRDSSSMKATYTSESASCFGGCDGSVQLFVINEIPPCRYFWKTGDTTDFVDSLCQGVYDVMITDAQNCTRRIFPVVNAPLPIKADSTFIVHPYCNGMNGGLISVFISGGTLPYSYIWDGKPGTETLSGLEQAGNYVLKVVDSKNCTMDTVFTLLDYDTLSIDYTTKSVLCKDVCNGVVAIKASGGVEPYRYLWLVGSTNNFISNLCTGEYEVTVYDSNNCIVKAIIPLFVDSTYFPKDITAWSDTAIIYRSQSTTIYGSDYGAGFDYTWSPEDFLNTTKGVKVTSTPKNTIIYTYTVSDTNGCFGMDTVLITVLEVVCDDPIVFVPNVFSPNGDGNNDILYVRGRVLEKVEFAIYDRWGEKLFETKDKNIGWDGTFRGTACSPGVYVYYLDAVCIGGERYLHKGNVTLVR